jgi:hypothetical protein
MRDKDLEALTGIENATGGRIRPAIKKLDGTLVEVCEGKPVEVVKCTECGKLHEVGKETYFDLIGNLHVGGGGGILGNGNWSGVGVPVNYWCIDNACFSKFIRKQEIDIVDRRDNQFDHLMKEF